MQPRLFENRRNDVHRNFNPTLIIIMSTAGFLSFGWLILPLVRAGYDDPSLFSEPMYLAGVGVCAAVIIVPGLIMGILGVILDACEAEQRWALQQHRRPANHTPTLYQQNAPRVIAPVVREERVVVREETLTQRYPSN